MKNINTKFYWNNRFVSGDCEQKRDRNQIKSIVISQIRRLNIPKSFSGTILDFGCGLGDAFPIYKKAFPEARLIGLDISDEAIKKCKESYNHLAEFICGDFTDAPIVDIIIASNVFEHLSDNRLIVKHLIKKCRQLNIIVPYKERLFQGNEHVNTYNEDYFRGIGEYQYKIFTSAGWSQFGFWLFYHVHLKNILKILLGKPLTIRAKQIIFIFNYDL